MRLDGFLANSSTAYLVETKGSLSLPNLLEEIEKDLDRIYNDAFKDSFRRMASEGDRGYTFPANIRGLILSDCWRDEVALSWENNSGLVCKYPRITSLSKRAVKVGDYGGYPYYLLAGVTGPIEISEK